MLLTGFGTESFLLTPTGTLIVFQAPGAVQTYARSINNTGAIAGTYVDANGVYHGFVRTP